MAPERHLGTLEPCRMTKGHTLVCSPGRIRDLAADTPERCATRRAGTLLRPRDFRRLLGERAADRFLS